MIYDVSGTAETLALGVAIVLADLSLARAGADLVVELGGGDRVTILDQFHTAHTARKVESIALAGGAVLQWQQIQDLLLAQAATVGNDTVVGYHTDDTLRGGLGDDRLEGLSGDDTYLFDPGDGRDVIADTSGTECCGWVRASWPASSSSRSTAATS